MGLKGLGHLIYIKREVEFKEAVATNVAATVREFKPKQVLFTFPHVQRRDRYLVDGWKFDDQVKEEFQITSDLSPVRLFLATYSNEFARPFDCPDKTEQGFTFCPEAAPYGDDKLIFMGSKKVSEKVMLDDNCEAYGMDGDDQFVLKAAVVRRGVKMNGGDGRDIIDITNTFFGSRSSVTGGGLEGHHQDRPWRLYHCS